MKQFFKALVIFGIPILIITLVFEVYLRTMNTDYKQKLEGFIENYKNIEVLILGNSHAYNGIDPRQFDLVTYNMAASNQSLYFDKRITLKHFDELSSLKYVLISSDYHSFYFSSQGIRDTWLYYDYNIKYKEKTEFWSNISYFWFGYTPRIAVSVVKDKVLSIKYSTDGDDEVINGWIPNSSTDLNAFTETSLKKKAKWFNTEVQNSNERKSIITDLDNFINELKERGIIPVLYTLPMYNQIYQYLDSSYTKQNKEDISFLIKKHNIQYIDLSKDTLSLNKFFFKDMDHLNSKGAELVSKKINNSILEIKEE